MTSMLEKAIEAVHHVEREKGDAFDIGDAMAAKIARAVLLAIREPDDGVRYDGDRVLANAMHNGGTITDTVLLIHQAMIDAIMGEEEL